ncbi:hypothetical protein BKP45_08465 [Anaerobacillus alkalidiazotrophicus]|uniref:histidine kinase n=1 Tax=Anaerobacillus alkalidiazotrophicus TaxID=472963 RepID=A0A1S2M8A3_9BACI|nr:PAS domain S-box protein [Anaerobacillus alkalidiazotrophicus]OIJ20816.1 hypothetical protein BKP45_08465 [Anaerobacillus alkalidiazotrophicus]
MEINKLDILDVLDKITDCFYVLDENWKIIYLNNEGEKIVNRTRDELIGKNIWAEFPELVDLPLYTNLYLAMEKRLPINFEMYHPIYKKWFNVRIYPIKEGLSVYFLDISDTKKINIRLEQHYQSLFDNNPDAVCSFDLDGRYIKVNDSLEKLTGYSETELLYQPFNPLIVKEDLKRTKEHFYKASKGIPQTYEYRIIHKSGRIIHWKVKNIPITVDDEIIGVFEIAKDITLQKIAEERIEKSEKLSLVGQLSASIAHEIRNPLTTLKGFLQLIRSQKGIDPIHIDIMLSEMDRIELITSELLFLAKPQSIEIKYANLKEIINDVVVLLQSQALMKNIEIVFEYQDVEPIRCVSNQLKQVFINLIKNAIESMSNEGRITISLVNLCNDNIMIEIIDQGCGISPELAKNIGLPFYSTKEKGTGLGMVTTYKIINDHGGKINFESKIGEGTTFRITFPKKLKNSFHNANN